MATVFLGNFDFEHELASPRYQPTRTLRRINAELAFHLAALTEPGDSVWLSEPSSPEFIDAWSELAGGITASSTQRTAGENASAWGWSEAARRQCEAARWSVAGPSLASVRTANSRRFSHETEGELGIELAGSRVISSLADLTTAVRDISQAKQIDSATMAWVVKAEFGMSARERIVGRGVTLPDPARRWLEKRLAAGEWLVFEPWLDRVAEYGVLFWIEPASESSPSLARLCCVAELITDATGRYLGTRLAPPPSGTEFTTDFPDTVPSREFMQRLAATGYFGPVGIDVMRYRDHLGQLQWRLVQDVNARWTMGFVAQGWARKLAPDRWASWVLVDTPRMCQRLGIELSAESDAQACREFELRLPAGLLGESKSVAAWRTSPVWVGQQATRQTAILLAADSRDELLLAERELHDHSTRMQ